MGEESPGLEDASDNAETRRASHPALWTRLKVEVRWNKDRLIVNIVNQLLLGGGRRSV